MVKERILVVEDDDQTAHYLKIYFDWLGYDVSITGSGTQAIELCLLEFPRLVILDVTLPDMNGYDVCRTLRNNSRTNQIPIIYLSQRSRRNDIIAAFELGADDYVTKPFDIEELKLRVESTLRRSRYESFLHPVTKLPAGELIVERLRLVKDSAEPWILLYFGIDNLPTIKSLTVSKLIHENLIEMANLLRQTIEDHGTPNDFIGQASDDSFIVITIPEAASAICQTIAAQFDNVAVSPNGNPQAAQAIDLVVGAVSSYDGPFTDIKQIAKTLAQLGFKRPEDGCADAARVVRSHVKDIDYCNQLAEQASLWRTAPQLAQALIEVERMTAARVPDMDKVKSLFNVGDEIEVSPEVLGQLKDQQHRAYLTSENLRLLQYKIRPYQEFKPSSLLKTLETTLNLCKFEVQLTVSPAKSRKTDIKVALPEVSLQQVIYNAGRWLLYDDERAKLAISVERGDNSVNLKWSLPGTKQNLPDGLDLLQALYLHKPGAVYGYLLHKVLLRYGGSLTSAQDHITVALPLALNETRLKKDELEAIGQKIREHRLFLEAQKRLTFPPNISDKAATLINPLAEDLLGEIEAMITRLTRSPGLVSKAYPWSAIERNYRFFRMLTLDLQKDRPIIPAPVNLKSLLESIQPMLTHRIFDHKLIIEVDVARPVITTDQMRLSQIFVNLALNALEAMPDGGTLKFHIKKDAHHYLVEMIDTGFGIPPEDQPHIFGAHFTTKGAEYGGMGLYHVKNYLQQLNGQMEIQSKLGQGTKVIIKLPSSWESGYF